MNKKERIKVGISGIRGIIGETLTPEISINFARAFATYLGKGKIAVGTDTRISSQLIKKAVISGILSSGINTIDISVVPTPTIQNYIAEKKLDGGIVITASHNPEEWNGLKFIDSSGLFLSPFSALNLIDIYHQGAFKTCSKNEFPEIEVDKNAFKIHSKKILNIVDTKLIKKRKFKVFIDPGGGAASYYDKCFLESLGCTVSIINNAPSKYFPRKPEPSPENLTKSSKSMKNKDFDVGFAQDADADRLAILDEKGIPVGEEYTLAIALMGFLNKVDNKKVVINLSTSKITETCIKREGGKVIKAPVGEINVVKKMISEKASAGGEGNGGVIIPGVHYCRDSFTAMALILETLTQKNTTVSKIISNLPKYKMVKTKIPFSMTSAHRIISILKDEFPSANTIDGIRVDKDDYWFHIRPSNTESVLRIVAEGKNKNIKKIVEALIKKIKQKEE